ncbi:MAG: glycosyltransferase [Verrucomicrobiota bacterium]|jgi:glycosyltransferase involved in cell wall biosynthesis
MNANAAYMPEVQPAAAAKPVNAAARGTRQLNICIASPEFIGLTRHSSTGVAYTALGQALVAAGHHVTCLFLGAKDSSPNAWEQWVEKYKRDGLTLIAVPRLHDSRMVAPLHLIKSYETYHWLKRNDRFDIIHFPDRQGPGYHTLTAKHHGLAFGRTTICVGLHSMSAWLKAVDQDYVKDSAEADTEFMERRTVALADAVVSPSQYLLNWVSRQQWELPRQCHVQPNILPQYARSAEPPATAHCREIDELVYFGTLETRKGVILFCDALDAIPTAISKRIRIVTFLGTESIVDGVPARTYVQKRAQRWLFPSQIITGHDTNRTMEYLRQKNRLAVIPSLLENSPYRVLECLVAGTVFVASRVGGTPELIAPDDVDKVCFEPTAGALCAVLCTALTEGLRPARALVDTRDNEQAWIALHENSFAQPNLPVKARTAALDAELPSSLPDLSNEAERAAIHALSIDPTNVVALKVLARIHLRAGLREAAEEACQLVLKQDADDAEALEMFEEARMQETHTAQDPPEANASVPALEPGPSRSSTGNLTAHLA